jgi:hypothetical protein
MTARLSVKRRKLQAFGAPFRLHKMGLVDKNGVTVNYTKPVQFGSGECGPMIYDMAIYGESPLTRMVKHASLFILASCFLTELGSNLAIGQATEPARVFKPALDQIQSKTRIPMLLPSRLPSAIPESGIKLARGEVRKDGYFISLFYTKDANASYAAGFGASALILQDHDLPNSARVALSGGRTGIFRPVSCGGSCAPANLWWEQNGVMYQIQVKLGYDMPEKEQQNILVEAANLCVSVR